MPIFDYSPAWLSKFDFKKNQIEFIVLENKLFVYYFAEQNNFSVYSC